MNRKITVFCGIFVLITLASLPSTIAYNYGENAYGYCFYGFCLPPTEIPEPVEIGDLKKAQDIYFGREIISWVLLIGVLSGTLIWVYW